MSNVIAQGQAANVMPPVKDKVLCITLDATSRKYDLGNAQFGDMPIDAGGELFLTFVATVKFWYVLTDVDPGGAVVDETAALAAGGAVNGFTANAPWEVQANTPESVRIDRKRHRWLMVKGVAGQLRIRASSDSTGRR